MTKVKKTIPKNKVISFPGTKFKIDKLTRENIDIILDSGNRVETALIAFRQDDIVSIFVTKYSAELVGLIELAKGRIIEGMFEFGDLDED